MNPTIISIVSGLISNGLPKVADAILDKGIDYVQDKLGTELKPEGEANQDYYETVRQAAMKHEEFMYAEEVKDRISARDREVAIATSSVVPELNKLVTPILALTVVVLSFILFTVLLFIDIRQEAKDILIYILGILSASVLQILSYYFGSSQGSKDKGHALQGMMMK